VSRWAPRARRALASSAARAAPSDTPRWPTAVWCEPALPPLGLQPGARCSNSGVAQIMHNTLDATLAYSSALPALPPAMAQRWVSAATAARRCSISS
jgi:hypothetical protein